MPTGQEGTSEPSAYWCVGLSEEWTIPEFYPMGWLPNGVRLTAYSGEAEGLAATVSQGYRDAVAAGAPCPATHLLRQRSGPQRWVAFLVQRVAALPQEVHMDRARRTRCTARPMAVSR